MTFNIPSPLNGTSWAGQRIGLLGGSFNPAHAGHLHISLIALRTLRLDFIWWLVTPQNPLKDPATLMDYDRRLASARLQAAHPRLVVTDLERELGTSRTYDTLRLLTSRFGTAEFILLTGTDNALSFHKWHRWRDLLGFVPTAHIARPPAGALVRACPLRQYRPQRHIVDPRGGAPALRPGLTYWLLNHPTRSISATSIRNSATWPT